jgi:hypothetical protein
MERRCPACSHRRTKQMVHLVLTSVPLNGPSSVYAYTHTHTHTRSIATMSTCWVGGDSQALCIYMSHVCVLAVTTAVDHHDHNEHTVFQATKRMSVLPTHVMRPCASSMQASALKQFCNHCRSPADKEPLEPTSTAEVLAMLA